MLSQSGTDFDTSMIKSCAGASFFGMTFSQSSRLWLTNYLNPKAGTGAVCLSFSLLYLDEPLIAILDRHHI